MRKLSLSDIDDEIAAWSRALARCARRVIELVTEFDRRGGSRTTGHASTAEWLAARCDLSKGAAREHVRVVRALRDLPAIRKAFADGEISYSRVRCVTRAATPESEDVLLNQARRVRSADELETIVRAFRTRQIVEDPEQAQTQRSLTTWESHGMGKLRAVLPVDDMATVRLALEAAGDAPGVPAGTPPDDFKGTPPWERRRADALVTLARAFLEGGTAGRSRTPYQVMVHVDTRDASARLDDGPQLSTQTAERILCDASMVRVLRAPSGAPLDIGRKTPVVPASIRRAVWVRDDGRCQYGLCQNRRFLDVHHVIHWINGGPTSVENLILLCRMHHREVHGGHLHRSSPAGRVSGHAQGARRGGQRDCLDSVAPVPDG